MWTLDFEHKEYDLSDLRHKIQTANDLGYIIELSTNEKNHVVFTYAKKIPKDLPWELK